MSKPRIVTISDHVDAPTGFGRQHRILCDALAATGAYDLVSLGLWDKGTIRNDPAGFLRIPVDDPATPVPAVLGQRWPDLLHDLRPDVLLTWGDLWMYDALARHGERPPC